MLANKGIPFASWVWQLLPLHIEFVLFGFVGQLVIGVAFWILPRFTGGKRGNEMRYCVVILCLNLGLWLAGSSEWLWFPGWFLLVGRVLEGLAAVLFVINSWPRVKPSSSRQP